jgi:hypothetical protein
LEQVKEIKLIELTGQEVYHRVNIPKKNLNIDLTNMSRGIYFLQIRTKKNLEVYRIIKD